ncbi:MAG: hypothetical protein AAFU77_05685 [Myxococcota bacterium]
MSRRKRSSRETVLNVLADAVNVDSPNTVMIVDRGLLRWAMAVATPESKRETVVAPLRRRSLSGTPRRLTG